VISGSPVQMPRSALPEISGSVFVSEPDAKGGPSPGLPSIKPAISKVFQAKNKVDVA